MSRTTRRVVAAIAGWYGIGGLYVGLMFGTAVASVEVALAGAALAMCSAAAVAALIFLSVCRLIARAVAQTSRPAV